MLVTILVRGSRGLGVQNGSIVGLWEWIRSRNAGREHCRVMGVDRSRRVGVRVRSEAESGLNQSRIAKIIRSLSRISFLPDSAA